MTGTERSEGHAKEKGKQHNPLSRSKHGRRPQRGTQGPGWRRAIWTDPEHWAHCLLRQVEN
jgi:hypothetical protein